MFVCVIVCKFVIDFNYIHIYQIRNNNTIFSFLNKYTIVILGLWARKARVITTSTLNGIVMPTTRKFTPILSEKKTTQEPTKKNERQALVRKLKTFLHVQSNLNEKQTKRIQLLLSMIQDSLQAMNDELNETPSTKPFKIECEVVFV